MNSQDPKAESERQALEARVAEQERYLERLQSTLAEMRIAMDKLQERVTQLYLKAVAYCETCEIEFDVVANHYSIGLFDNIVYVKCPRCNKALPMDSRGGIKKA